MITRDDIQKLETHVKDRLRTPELDGLFNNLYKKVAPTMPDNFGTVLLPYNDGSGSDQKVSWEKCCEALHQELLYTAPSPLSPGQYKFFDVHYGGHPVRPFIGTAHTAGYWQLHYCPYCGTKINIQPYHPF
jgi:hypothetical protein